MSCKSGSYPPPRKSCQSSDETQKGTACAATDTRLTYRVQWIDAAKCIGILMVMFGHNWLDSKFCYYFYAFHMPLFFILAGLTFSAKKDFASFIKSKAKSLICPYIFFALCILAFYGALSTISGSNSYDIKQNAYRFIIQDHHTMLWFLMALFLAEIMVYMIVKTVENRYTEHKFTIFTVAATVLIGFHWFTLRMGWIKLAWVLDLVPICTAFILIGILYKKFGGKSHIEKNKWFVCIVFVMSLGIATLNYVLSREPVDMFRSSFGYYPLFVIGALAATYSLFLLLKKVTLPDWCLYIGIYSLIYYGFHRFIIEIMFILYHKCSIPVELNQLSGLLLAILNVIVACAVIYPISHFILRRCPWVIGKF